ncbi:gamma-glutamyl-gamma-aminobutyrate hydrolase family protein, partial [Campylobacter jejuni]|nr:gamma-glutamyl-gamma-aminobutyrate hydrolase family protein [Campylobacter jejuni]
HQCIAEIFGGRVSKMQNPMHGKISKLYFKKDPIFKGIKKEIEICLYHSLHISFMPKKCKILAHNSENIIMAIKHKKYPIYGLQFHPEAVLTQKGKKILKNFMKL